MTWPLPTSPTSLLTLFLSFTLLQPTLAFFTFLFFSFSPQRQLFALVNPALDIVNLFSITKTSHLRHHTSEKTSPLYLEGIFFLAPLPGPSCFPALLPPCHFPQSKIISFPSYLYHIMYNIISVIALQDHDSTNRLTSAVEVFNTESHA